MSRFKHLALRITAVLVVMSFHAVPVHAQGERQGRSRPAPPRTPAFGIGGVYTGVVNGAISIDGVGYPISSNVQVYLLGEGLVPISMVPIGNHIYASGRGMLGTNMVEMLIARPVNEDERTAGTEPEIKLRDPSAPK